MPVKVAEFDVGQKFEIFYSSETGALYFDVGKSGKIIPLRSSDVKAITNCITYETMAAKQNQAVMNEMYNKRLELLDRYHASITAIRNSVEANETATAKVGEEVDRTVDVPKTPKTQPEKPVMEKKEESTLEEKESTYISAIQMAKEIARNSLKQHQENTPEVPCAPEKPVKVIIHRAGYVEPIRF